MNEPHLAVWKDKYGPTRPRRLLALDGGGILGIMTLAILKEIERQVAESTGQGARFRLGDFFDYVGGTSTGSIIAAGLSLGMSVDELLDFYQSSGRAMFEKEWLWRRARALYQADPLKKKLQDVLGADRTLGAEDLRCLLLIVTRNATTDSPWPISNNPFAKYNDRQRSNCNLDIPLWQLVRASTAAPVYFPPQDLKFGAQEAFTFMDGGITPYNNPAFLLYRMATIPEFHLQWPAGEKDLMLISVGTGSAPKIAYDVDESGSLIFKNLATLPGILMGGISVDQDINCRAVGRCLIGREIDRELGDMRLNPDTPEADEGRAFLYARFDPDVTLKGLTELGLKHISPSEVNAMDDVDDMAAMLEVGTAYAKRHVDMTKFAHLWKAGGAR